MRWLDVVRDIVSPLRRVCTLEGNIKMTHEQINAMKADADPVDVPAPVDGGTTPLDAGTPAV